MDIPNVGTEDQTAVKSWLSGLRSLWERGMPADVSAAASTGLHFWKMNGKPGEAAACGIAAGKLYAQMRRAA